MPLNISVFHRVKMNLTNTSLCEDSELYMIPIGVACSIGCDLSFSLSFVVQKMAHNGNTLQVSVLLLPYWWLGMVFLIIGEVGEFVAYGLAPTSLISPLGTAAGNDFIESLDFLVDMCNKCVHNAVIFNAILSRIVLGEHLPWSGWIGISSGLIGCVLSIRYSPCNGGAKCRILLHPLLAPRYSAGVEL